MQKDTEQLVSEAIDGSKQALEQVIGRIQDMIYNLSLKMLLFPEDARDATQEILIKVITRLSTFRGNSKFTTWVYKIAVNHLINVKGRQSRQFAMSFDEYAAVIDAGHSDTVSHARNAGELALLEEEVKVSCTQGLLLCLEETDRMIYILTVVMNYNSREGAEVLNISPENFRQRLARSRKKIRVFLENKCGLANADNPCRCTKKIDFLIDRRLFDPGALRYAHLTRRSIDMVEALEELERDAAIYQSVPPLKTPRELRRRLEDILKKTEKGAMGWKLN